jgi:hypothetical protein
MKKWSQNAKSHLIGAGIILNQQKICFKQWYGMSLWNSILKVKKTEYKMKNEIGF